MVYFNQSLIGWCRINKKRHRGKLKNLYFNFGWPLTKPFSLVQVFGDLASD